jgi:hypothetical protein
MDVAEREWISLQEQQVGLPMTTIRDWSRQGTIETKESSTGRLVDVEQVREKAMGPVVVNRPSGLQDRVADGTPERAPGRPTRDQELGWRAAVGMDASPDPYTRDAERLGLRHE